MTPQTTKWLLVEHSSIPKTVGTAGEDRSLLAQGVASDGVYAVADGATDKSGRDYGGQTGGARAADTVIAAIAAASPHQSPAETVAAVTNALVTLRREWGIADDDVLAPSAVAAALAPAAEMVWRVGDVHIAVRRGDGWQHYPADKRIDRIVAAARAALLTCHLADGVPAEELAAADAGRDMMMPLLQAQNALANRDDDSPLGFGVLDGRRVPARYIDTVDVTGSDEVVLATDGYLSAAPTLQAAEAELADDLARDPLRIGTHAATKAPPPGAKSFDDRTYMRLERA